MAETHKDSITLINGEAAAIPPYRRVKYDGANAGYVVYADQADGDSWIGVTLPHDGGDPANGEPVAVELRGENKTLKMEASAAITANASIYPEDDGKISASAGTVVIGTAAGASVASAANSIVEVHPNAGSGSAPGAGAVANADTTQKTGVVIGIFKEGITAQGTTAMGVFGRKVKILDAIFYQRGTTATNINLLVGATTITRADSAAGTTANARKLLEITAAGDEVAAASTIIVSSSETNATGVDVHIFAVPIT